MSHPAIGTLNPACMVSWHLGIWPLASDTWASDTWAPGTWVPGTWAHLTHRLHLHGHLIYCSEHLDSLKIATSAHSLALLFPYHWIALLPENNTSFAMFCAKVWHYNKAGQGRSNDKHFPPTSFINVFTLKIKQECLKLQHHCASVQRV